MCYILYTNKLWIYFSYHYSITLIPFSIFSLPISLDLFNLPVISYYISKYFIFSIFIIEIHVTDDLLLILYLFYVYYLMQVNLYKVLAVERVNISDLQIKCMVFYWKIHVLSNMQTYGLIYTHNLFIWMINTLLWIYLWILVFHRIVVDIFISVYLLIQWRGLLFIVCMNKLFY